MHAHQMHTAPSPCSRRSVGVDEGWEGCGQGVNGTQHAADGTPTIDAAFPDTKGMVQSIHGLGLSAGWYLNGCKCGERTEHTINYEGDIRSLHAFDFDGVKIDGCGRQRNQTLYAALMKSSGKNYTIENCHWGDCTSSDDSSCPTQEWCPFNWCVVSVGSPVVSRCIPLYPVVPRCTPLYPAIPHCTPLYPVVPRCTRCTPCTTLSQVPNLRRHQLGCIVVARQPADHDQVPRLRRAALRAWLLGLPRHARSGQSRRARPRLLLHVEPRPLR